MNFFKPRTIKRTEKYTVFIFCDDLESCEVLVGLKRQYNVILSSCDNPEFYALIDTNPHLFLFIASNLKKSLRIVDSRPDLFGNPLSIMWWPQKRSISDIDLIQCAQRGIDCLTNKKTENQVSFSKIKGRLRAISLSQSIYQRDMLSAAPLVQPMNQESELVNEIVTYLGRNNLNEEFSIEKMGTDLGMSRTKFFNRVKAITGQSPSRLVMNFRLKKAAVLLDGKRTNVSEVAFEVGFSSTAYFTKCFKDQFGKSPTQYMKIRTQRKLLNPLNIDPFTVSMAV